MCCHDKCLLFGVIMMLVTVKRKLCSCGFICRNWCTLFDLFCDVVVIRSLIISLMVRVVPASPLVVWLSVVRSVSFACSAIVVPYFRTLVARVSVITAVGASYCEGASCDCRGW